jgi:hypothetical protein
MTPPIFRPLRLNLGNKAGEPATRHGYGRANILPVYSRALQIPQVRLFVGYIMAIFKALTLFRPASIII